MSGAPLLAGGEAACDPLTTDCEQGGPGRNALFSAIQSTRMPMILTDPHRHDNPIIFANRAFVEMSGYAIEELIGRNCRFMQGEETSPADIAKIRQAIESRSKIAVDIVNYRKNGQRFVNELYISPVYGATGDLLYFFGSQVDITAYSEARLSTQMALIERERHVLRRIAEGVPLVEVLEDLLRAVEAQFDHGMRSSILLLSEDRRHLLHGAAPSLPAAYNAAIDGIAIGEGVGSCGTVASRGTPVYATDIATDPLWVDFRDLALSHDLRACWSSPIKAVKGDLLGTFAIYYGKPRSPTPGETAAIEFITQTAALAIERHRTELALHQGEEKRKEINDALQAANRRLEEINESLGRTVEQRTKALRLFGNIVQSDLAPILAYDRDLKVIAFNKAHLEAFQRVMGRRPETGERLPDLFPPEQGATLRGFMERALSGESFSVIENFGDPKHELSTWEITYSPLQDEAGSVFGAFHVARDVSARYRAERERDAVSVRLAEQNAASERTWQYTPDLLSVIDIPSGIFERVNPSWSKALGWSAVEMEEHSYLDFVHPDDTGASASAFERVRAGKPVLRFENRYRHKDGTWRRLSWVAFPEGHKLYSSTRNVTAEAEMAEARHLFENIAQSNDAPICAFDRDCRLIAFNKAHSDEFFRIFAHRVTVGEVFPDLFPPEQAAIMRGFMTRALGGETYTVTEEFGDPDLAKPCWEVSYSPLRDTNGRIIGAFHIAKDVTSRLKAEAELAITQEALRQSQKMEAVGQLTGGLAHDFNNLLAGISGSLELMQMRMQQGRLTDVDRYLTAAQGAAKRAAALTHRLLAFSRRQTLDPRPTNVNRLAQGMQELIQRTVGPTIAVEVVGASGAWPALVDPSQLENALLNLCINARDAMPGGGRITVETANKWFDEQAARKQTVPEGQYLSLCVTDTGTGMPPEVVARVFEPFFTTKPIGEGTGLGLSMIYGFAQQSGGQVRIYSEVGEGTTVCIYLPRYYGAVDEDATAAKPAALPRAEQGEIVLIVDDEPTVRMLVTDILEDLGHTAIEAGDSAAGLRILQSDVHLDLLITDVGLPGGMNGRQMADAARVSRPDLKVLFITGYAENALLGNGQLAPGMAVLTKPFAVDTMAARIRSMIEAGREARRA